MGAPKQLRYFHRVAEREVGEGCNELEKACAFGVTSSWVANPTAPHWHIQYLLNGALDLERNAGAPSKTLNWIKKKNRDPGGRGQWCTQHEDRLVAVPPGQTVRTAGGWRMPPDDSYFQDVGTLPGQQDLGTEVVL